ncbi:hypothetical protein [Lishizhenia sp.]|uniref:hypothetical protein n=1 Tax=Lishizhenia sp. TaxID=2497594 RepID=UPI00299E942E|nr:hypothetical protein [Lishizhenia sp.]MDX1445749.1 hypothetical protein [Lishizhenia sp.]
MKGKFLMLILLASFTANCQVYLGNIRDSVATVHEIVGNNQLLIFYGGARDTCSKVLGFEAYIITTLKDTITLRSSIRTPQTNCFTAAEIKRIKMMRPGDILYIPVCWQSCSSCVLRRRNINLKVRIKL